MKVFIDFDDVIFHTKKFKEDFRDMFARQGISGEIFDECYVDPLDSRALKTFDPWAQSDRICKRISDIDKEHINKCVREFIGDVSTYLFDDVRDFAEAIGKENIAIVSFGEKEFQNVKIGNSGIGKYVEKLFVTQDSKAHAIGEIIAAGNGDEKMFFIDDRAEQIEDVKNNFPGIVTIFLKRPEGRYQEMKKEKCCDHEVHSLTEAKELILSL